MLLVAVMFCLVMYTSQESMESLEDVLVYPMEPATVRYKYIYHLININSPNKY